MKVFYDDIECIPTKIRLSFNLLWILLSFVIGVTHQNVGILMGFTGGVLGFILVSVIPVLFNYKCLYKGESYSLKKTSDTDPNI